jgi:hypothetical protein
MPGVPLQDLWTDVKPVGAKATERLGFPTQKPEALLNRIIAASSNPGDVVLDPFCGCGTTLAVAEKERRQWLGIDISPTAVNLITRRLIKLGASPRTIGMPRTVADLHDLKPFEFQNWVIQQIHGIHSPRKSGDMGIDGYSFFEKLPVQVKQSDKVGRNVVDNFETAVRRGRHHRGYIFAFSFTAGAHEEAARAKREGLEIELVDITILTGERLPARSGSMMQDLLAAIEQAKFELQGSRPDRSIADLVESDRQRPLTR